MNKAKMSVLKAANAVFTILAMVVSLLFPVLVPQAVFAESVVLFEDDFNQSGDNLTNMWDNFSGASSPERKITDSPNSFSVGVSDTKGMLFEGSGGSNPDDGAERNVATKGYALLNVEYSRAIEEFGSGDEFKAEYSLD